jgi:hypothetical protein
MTPKDGKALRRGRLWAAAALALLVVHGGCGLDEVEIPDLEGPSELALSIALTANPDIIVADGLSTSLVEATVRDQNGRPVAGREIFFSIADESGRPADLGLLRAPGTSVGLGTGLVVRTNAQGIAQVIYESPARTDATANQLLQVTARPVGTDASSALSRSVRIELRSAEPRLFPQNPNNAAPSCDFAVQAPFGFRVNQSILVQSTSFDTDGTIVRYFWDFGNGRRADSPDAATSYRLPGSYTITHIVTDNNGAQAACANRDPIDIR